MTTFAISWAGSLFFGFLYAVTGGDLSLMFSLFMFAFPFGFALMTGGAEP